jgi:hypothetical protein
LTDLLIDSAVTTYFLRFDVRVFYRIRQAEGFYDSLLKQVLVGAESQVTRSQVSDALGDHHGKNVEVFKVRAAFRSFQIVRNKNEKLWT